MEGALLLDVVVREGPKNKYCYQRGSKNRLVFKQLGTSGENRPAILELLAGEDQPLLVRRDAFLVLDLCLHILDCVGRLDLGTEPF